MAHILKLTSNEEAHVASVRSGNDANYCIGDIVQYDLLTDTFSKVPDPVTPVVNLNGTSRQDLAKQYFAAHNAVLAAISAHNGASPHGRDYQTVDSSVYRTAIAEFRSRANRLEIIRKELESILTAIVE